MTNPRRKKNETEVDKNADPITGEHGAHPIGVGLGAAAGGAAAGAAAGSVAGPVGAAVGAVIGGVAGGYAGKAVAEEIDPTVESSYWRDEYPRRDYFSDDIAYDEIDPAYRYGWESRYQYEGCTFKEAEKDLQRNWSTRRGNSTLDWDTARPAVCDAWERVEKRRAKPKTK